MIVRMRTRKAYQVNYEILQKSVKHTCFCCVFALLHLDRTEQKYCNSSGGATGFFPLLGSTTAEYMSNLSWQKHHHAVQS